MINWIDRETNRWMTDEIWMEREIHLLDGRWMYDG